MKNFKYEKIDCPCNNCQGAGCPVCSGRGFLDQIKSDYIIVTAPKVAVEFLGKRFIFVPYEITGKREFKDCIMSAHDLDYLVREIGYFKIHKSVVKEIMTPEEGDAVFLWNEENIYSPVYSHEYSLGVKCAYEYKIKENALSSGLIVGELKELYEWYEGE